MLPTNRIITGLAFLLVCVQFASSQVLRVEDVSGASNWVDPAINTTVGTQTVVVWFDKQLLGNGDSYLRRIREFEGEKRSAIRSKVINTLKDVSNRSFSSVQNELARLQVSGDIRNLKQHWIINGFSCDVTEQGLETLRRLDGVAKIFRKQPVFNTSNRDQGPEYLQQIPPSRFDPENIESYPWNIEKIRAPEVWATFGINGDGTLNVVHDFGFKLDIPPLAETLYVNTGEIPGNNVDDDKNGFIDDYHGFDFDSNSSSVNNPGIRRASIIHGNACAAMICGTFETGTRQAIGIAPGSKWAPVIGASNIEQAVEWAVEQGADTYSMSFSQPNLGEFRSHWRKVLEHATLCGIVFISGAGNFAAGNNAAPVPVQMRNPEDIPNVVLGVAGIGQDGRRPVFSSQGPVEWNTEHYKDGRINKPDFATLNFQIPCVDPEGKLTNNGSGNSFAGPHIAGIVSLMLSANPELTPWEVKEILIETATDIEAQGFDFQSGHGFVNAFDAVELAIMRKF